MSASKLRWDIKIPDPAIVEQFVERLGISLPLAKILVNRGIKDVSSAEQFLNPDIANLFNPFLLMDVEKSIHRLKQAIDRKEKILIYSDGDVDGITGLAIAKSALDSWGGNTLWYVPGDEGYGLDKEIISHYQQLGVKLILTVDCGISALEEIAYAQGQGIDVIVTDHHEPQQELPAAYALVNPKRSDSGYPFSELAGCGVAFKLGQALTFSASPYLDKSFAVLDIETTGFHPWLDEIIEIGAVEIINWKERINFHSLIKPEKNISPSASAYHGITEQMCLSASPLKEVLVKFLDFIGDKIIVLHNKEFILGFINYALEKNQLPKISGEVIDTLEFSRQHFPFHSHTLEYLSKELGFVSPVRHRALTDARSTAHIFQRLVELTDLDMKFFIQEQLDLVCLGTIADSVPLVGENRILAKEGIKSLSRTKRPGLAVLRDYFSPTGKKISSKTINWGIIPLLNAPSRRSKAALAVDLLLAPNREKAREVLDQIVLLNEERRRLQSENLEKFTYQLLQQCDPINDRIFVVVAHNLEPGVTGVVASRISRQYWRPVVLLIASGEEVVGSGRSIPGLNLVEAFSHCQDLLIKFGGHKLAAGLTLALDKVEQFRQRLKNFAKDTLKDEDLIPKITVDAEIDNSFISTKFIEELKNLEPYGVGNAVVNFLLQKAKLKSYAAVGSGSKHLRLNLEGKDITLNAIGWNMAERIQELKEASLMDIVFQLELNIWQERESAQIILLDFKVRE